MRKGEKQNDERGFIFEQLLQKVLYPKYWWRRMMLTLVLLAVGMISLTMENLLHRAAWLFVFFVWFLSDISQRNDIVTDPASVSSVRIWDLLGKLGAPPPDLGSLEEEAIFGFVDTTIPTRRVSTNPTKILVVSWLEICLLEQEKLVKVVEKGLEWIEIATSLQFGGVAAIHRNGLHRLEKAAWNRLNNNNNNNRPFLRISLLTLRQRIFWWLQRMCTCLHQNPTDHLKNNAIVDKPCDDENVVLTLAVLRSKKEELLELLSHVAGRVLSKKDYEDESNETKSFLKQLKLATCLATQGCAYLSACFTDLRCSGDDGLEGVEKPREENDEEEKKKNLYEQEQQHTMAVLEKFRGEIHRLDISILALQDGIRAEHMYRRSHVPSPSSSYSPSAEWWPRIQTMAQRVQNLFERLDQHHFASLASTAQNKEPVPQSFPTMQDENKKNQTTYKTGEEDNEGFDPVLTMRATSPTKQQKRNSNNTLVFLESSTNALNYLDEDGDVQGYDGHDQHQRTGKIVHFWKSNDDKNGCRAGSRLDPLELQLLEELQNRLYAMPPAVEQLVLVTLQQQHSPSRSQPKMAIKLQLAPPFTENHVESNTWMGDRQFPTTKDDDGPAVEELLVPSAADVMTATSSPKFSSFQAELAAAMESQTDFDFSNDDSSNI